MTALEHERTTSTPWPRAIAGGILVDLVDQSAAMDVIAHYAHGRTTEQLALVSANLDHIHHFADDPSWLERSPASLDPDPPDSAAEGLHWMSLIDGAPLARRASKMTGVSWPRLAGSDLIDPVLDLAIEFGWRVGFLGGTPETHRTLRAVLADRRPALQVSGFWAPRRKDLFEPGAAGKLADDIAAADTTILVVGLGKPRQEQWIEEFGVRTEARVLLAFGAVVDFLAGRVKRAPRWAADNGVEWAWRLAKEPRRLSRRYLVQGPQAFLKLQRNSWPLLAQDSSAPTDGRLVAAQPELMSGRFVGPTESSAVTAVVVTYNSAKDLDGLLTSLRAEAVRTPLRVIACDNGSTDATVQMLRRHDDVTLIDDGVNAGYAAGINRALSEVTQTQAILILNPDIRIIGGAIAALLDRLRTPGCGAAVPMIVGDDGVVYPSIRREPSVLGTLGDALAGRHWPTRPSRLSEIDHRTTAYDAPRLIDWATGAAVMVAAEAAGAVGEWDERFFLYSEETDFFRRLRHHGYTVWFEPNAVVHHRGGGSGSSMAQAILMTVNKVRYAEKYMAPPRAWLFRQAMIAGELLRGSQQVHRRSATALLTAAGRDRAVATLADRLVRPSGTGHRGTVIIPAHNEAATIGRTLTSLAPAAETADVHVIVVCNGCTDDTAFRARAYPGVQVIEIAEASKTAALNEGDRAATTWPRLYLDADIECPSNTALAVLEQLADGATLAASPAANYDTVGATCLVQRYYRARRRISRPDRSLWGAGAYGLSEAGHARFGEFPQVSGDDLFVDGQFRPDEKRIVPTEPAIVRTPRTLRDLLGVQRRTSAGNSAYFRSPLSDLGFTTDSTTTTAATLLRTVRGPVSAADALVYAMVAIAGRVGRRGRGSLEWLRDESSRVSDETR